ncbi:MAG: hypothetical protein R6W72_07740 [Desulfurivibrionaceae bacterium]
MKERANDERSNRAVVSGGHVTYRGKRFPLGKVKRGTAIPANGLNKTKAQRLRLEELES